MLELRGKPDSPVSQERIKGFHSMVDERANIQTSDIVEAGETRDGVEDLLKSHRGMLEGVDIIFAHNDYMALGAYRALQKMGIKDTKIVGIDGFTGEDGGIDLVRRGTIDQTLT